MSHLLQKAYDAEHFRKQGHQLVDLLADYLANTQQSDNPQKVLNHKTPAEMYHRWKEDLAQAPNPDASSYYQMMMQDIIHMHHPRYIGHQTSIVAPMSALAELVGATLDPGMGVYEQATAGVAIERLLSKKLGTLIGWNDQCDGFLTSGGTLGNLTALLCARQVMIGHDVWENGYQGKQYAFMVSSEAHYSVARAIKVMGMGEKGIVTVPVDDQYRLKADQLATCFEKAKNEGITIIGVIASSCSTATGSYDPIDAIADFCEARQLWLHVDGAHGACVLFSAKYRPLLKGIDRANSVIMDFHKMLMTPKLITSVLFKNAEDSYQTFAQKASYLWDKDEGKEWYNLGKRTFELTKSFMSIRVYALWRTYGEQIFADNVDTLYDIAKSFAVLIDTQSDFEMPLSTPSANIVCYRLRNEYWSEEQTEKINLNIREKLVQIGDFFIVQTRIQGKLFLRSTIMNPFTTLKDLEKLIQHIRTLGAEIALESN